MHPFHPRILLTLLAILLIIPLSSCGLSGSRAVKAYQAYDVPTKLPSNPSRVSVKVSLAAQRVYVKEGDKMLMAMPVSVGAPGSRTPSGNYSIFRKVHRHRANTHGYAYRGGAVKQTRIGGVPAGWSFTGTPMPYWCEFKPNYGFHTGWVKHHPCTHGCIRMHENLAPKFFRLVSIGTPVHIAQSQPEDAQYRNMKLPPDAGPLPDYSGDMYVGDGYFSRHKTPVYE